MVLATQARPDVAGIILVRHAPTAWTGSRYCGRSDPPFDANGVAAAQRLAGDLATTLAPGTHIVTSPLRRAHATATAIADAAGIDDIMIDDRWREADFGIAEGLAFEELERLAPALARRLADGETSIDWPDGERAEDLARRVTTAWRDLITAGDEVLVVSHAGPIRIALGLASGRAPGRVDLPDPGAAIRLSLTVPA
jgi:broad specificity phosphatase PhoE